MPNAISAGKEPTQCSLWENPSLVLGGMAARFELIETYVKESHIWRYLLKCRECGQLYFFEFREEIDWEDGDDPQYMTYIPVETAEDIDRLKNSSSFGLLAFFPRIQDDRPKGVVRGTPRWLR